jgi:hypothetical protein
MITNTKKPQKGEQKDSKSKKSQKKVCKPKLIIFYKLESKPSQKINQEQTIIFNTINRTKKLTKFKLKSLPKNIEKG